MKLLTLILILFCLSPVAAQTTIDFKKELTENKFTSVNKRKIPIDIIKLFGCDSYRKVGTKRTQAGCTGRKQIVIHWSVTDGNGLYVMSVSTSGRGSHTSVYIISKGVKYDTKTPYVRLNSFEDFLNVYLKGN